MLNTNYISGYNPTMSSGEFKCSCCGKPITFERSLLFKFDGKNDRCAYYFVGLESDEAGYDWRSFSKDCTPEVVELAEKTVYNSFPPSLEL